MAGNSALFAGLAGLVLGAIGAFFGDFLGGFDLGRGLVGDGFHRRILGRGEGVLTGFCGGVLRGFLGRLGGGFHLGRGFLSGDNLVGGSFHGGFGGFLGR